MKEKSSINIVDMCRVSPASGHRYYQLKSGLKCIFCGQDIEKKEINETKGR